MEDAFVHSHVFEPFGMRLFLATGTNAVCDLCNTRAAAVGILCNAAPLMLCRPCHDVRRIAWNIIVVYYDRTVEKFMWHGPDKSKTTTLPNVVKDWYFEHVS